MSDRPVYIDGVLKQWGDRLFYEPVKPKKSRRTPTGGQRRAKPSASGSSDSFAGGAGRIREKLLLTTRKAPEVLVKITSKASAGRGMRAVKEHLSYITRNGKLTLEDQDGNEIKGKKELADLQEEWKTGNGKFRIPEESSKREALNIIFSMPDKTTPRAVQEAVRAFARAEFGDNHQYVMALHTKDTDPDKKPSPNPHVHLCVKVRGNDGTRLNPRKADIQRWREGFAGQLRDHGVEANATSRTVRGVSRKAVKQPVLHAARQNRSTAMQGQRDALVRELTGGFQPNPHAARMNESRSVVRLAYSEIADALRQSADPKDRALGNDVRTFVDGMKPETRREEAARIFKEGKVKGKSADHSPER